MVVRCHFGLPVVVRMPPHLDDGTPFPTRYWLTCPLAVTRISRLEAGGGIAEMQERLAGDPRFAEAMARAHRRHAEDREAAIERRDAPRPSGGVAGIEGGGVKCLHAHYADHLASGDNPIGAWVALQVEPLDDAEPCVVEEGGLVVANPEWREPG